MLSQVVYETNADLIASHEAMVKNPLVVADKTEKGLLWFKFKENRTVFLLSPMGKLQVKWTDVSEKRTLFRLVKNLLVAKANEKIVINPLKQQTWIEYPVPESFKLYWCDTTTEFVLKTTPQTKKEEKSDRPKIINGFSESYVEKFKVELANVREVLEELRRELRFFREPTFNEIALKSECLDSKILRVWLTLAGWEPQSQEEAKRTAEEAINLAGWLRFKEKGELHPQLVALSKKAIDAASLDAVGRAQVILKNYPDLVPKVDVTTLRWPDEIKVKWMQIFGGESPAPQYWGTGIVFPQEVDDFLRDSVGGFKF